jgi:hypothetical protein
MAIGAQSRSLRRSGSNGAQFNPWNQFNPWALAATEPSARVYAEPGTMWTTPFTVSF